jgi:membrane protease YdiL (CAAX protease family)
LKIGFLRKKVGFSGKCSHYFQAKRLSPLKYREHEASDTGTTLLKLDTRTPPVVYDVKKNITPQSLRKTGINIPLVLAILANQALVFFGASLLAVGCLFFTDGLSAFAQLPETFRWAGGDATSAAEFGVSSSQFLFGAVGSLPSIFIGTLMERSDKRKFANTNFSTIIMVMTVFGRRNAPPKEFIPKQYRNLSFPTSSTLTVFVWSLIIAGITGFCEEFVFRCEIPSIITHYTGSAALAFLGQALLFGLGHASPRSNLTENGIVPCMIAHAIYDFQVFFFTWLSTNAQIEYADRMYLEPLPQDVQRTVSQLRVGDDNTIRSCKRLFYTFDYDKNKSLSLSEVRRGISYLWLQLGSRAPPPEKLVDSLFFSCTEGRGERMRFPEFVKLFTALPQSQGVKTFSQ